jgi:hypothetical protein
MWNGLAGVALFLGVFSFLAIAAWSGNRTRERELYYKSELLKKAMETPGPEAAAVLAHIRDQDARHARAAIREKRLGMVTGGLTVAGVGLGLMAFMRMAPGDTHAYYLVGLMPLMIGLALLVGSRLVKGEAE